MLKRLFSIFAFLLLLIPLSTIPACGEWFRYEVWICELDLLVGETMTNPAFTADGVYTFAEDETLRFMIIGEGGDQICWLPVNPFVQTAYAFSPCAEFQNFLQQSTFSLALDRDIQFGNQLIPAGTNLLDNPQIARQTEIDIESDCFLYIVSLQFSTASQNDFLFEQGEYELSFSCKTDDDRSLETSGRVIFMP